MIAHRYQGKAFRERMIAHRCKGKAFRERMIAHRYQGKTFQGKRGVVDVRAEGQRWPTSNHTSQ